MPGLTDPIRIRAVYLECVRFSTSVCIMLVVTCAGPCVTVYLHHISITSDERVISFESDNASAFKASVVAK